MKIYFSHGKESGPWGFKIKRLAEIGKHAGCGIESIDYTDQMDPDLRAERLLDVLQREAEPKILVGSSMGGYVSLVASASVVVDAMFLMAPALYITGFQKQSYPTLCKVTEIVHGWSDDVIPVEHSIRYAREADCTLHLISGDHPMNQSIDSIETLFESFLQKVCSP